MGRKTMAECMRGQATARRQEHAGLFHNALDVSDAEAPTAHAHEHRRLAVIVRFGSPDAIPLLEVRRHGAGSEVAERNDALLSSLAKHADKLLGHIEVLVIQPS